MLLYIEDNEIIAILFANSHEEARYVSSSPAGIAAIFLLSFSLARYRENMSKSDLVLYTAFFICVCVCFFYFWPSIKPWIVSLFLLTLFASSFPLVQLGLWYFRLCRYFGQKHLVIIAEEAELPVRFSFETFVSCICSIQNLQQCKQNLHMQFDWLRSRSVRNARINVAIWLIKDNVIDALNLFCCPITMHTSLTE